MLSRLIRNLLASAGRRPAATIDSRPVEQNQQSCGPTVREWLRRGEMLEAEGDLTTALECYRACALAHPTDLPARLALVNALASGWHIAECLTECAEALKLAPHDHEIFSGLLIYSHYVDQIDARALFEMHCDYGRLMSTMIAARPADLSRN